VKWEAEKGYEDLPSNESVDFSVASINSRAIAGLC